MDDVNVQAITDANKIAITVPKDWGSIEFRFRIDGGSDGNTYQIEEYIRSESTDGNDHWAHIATLNIQQGTQEYSGTIYFADVITDTNVAWLGSMRPVEPTNSIGTWSHDTYGSKQILFTISSMVDVTDAVYIDYRRLSR